MVGESSVLGHLFCYFFHLILVRSWFFCLLSQWIVASPYGKSHRRQVGRHRVFKPVCASEGEFLSNVLWLGLTYAYL